MKILVIILALLELFLALGSISSIFVDRHELARAVYSYHQQRTEENKKKMEAEQDITARIRLHFRMMMVGLFAANTCGLIVVCRRLKRKPLNVMRQSKNQSSANGAFLSQPGAPPQES